MIRAYLVVATAAAIVVPLLASGGAWAAEDDGVGEGRGIIPTETASEVFSKPPVADTPFSQDVDIDKRQADPFVPAAAQSAKVVGGDPESQEPDANRSSTRIGED